MSHHDSSSSFAIPTLVTFFAVAFGVMIGLVAGRDPAILYLITSPFAIILFWLASDVVGPDTSRIRREAILPRSSVDERQIPTMAHAHKA